MDNVDTATEKDLFTMRAKPIAGSEGYCIDWLSDGRCDTNVAGELIASLLLTELEMDEGTNGIEVTMPAVWADAAGVPFHDPDFADDRMFTGDPLTIRIHLVSLSTDERPCFVQTTIPDVLRDDLAVSEDGWGSGLLVIVAALRSLASTMEETMRSNEERAKALDGLRT